LSYATVATPVEPDTSTISDVSCGGLCFSTTGRLEPAQTIHVRIDVVSPPFEKRARVVWCQAKDDHYLVGVAFESPDDVFDLRMVEQICHIHAYRERVRRQENRDISAEQAAREWIERYAGTFPS
jgi:hypothetical protein